MRSVPVLLFVTTILQWCVASVEYNCTNRHCPAQQQLQQKCTVLLSVKLTPQTHISTHFNVTADACCDKCSATPACDTFCWSQGRCDIGIGIDNNGFASSTNSISGEVCSRMDNISVSDGSLSERRRLTLNSTHCVTRLGYKLLDTAVATRNVPVDQCCNECRQYRGCKGFTWNNNLCHLKQNTKIYEPVSDAGDYNLYVSGEACKQPIQPAKPPAKPAPGLPPWTIAIIVLLALAQVGVCAFVIVCTRRGRAFRKCVCGKVKEEEEEDPLGHVPMQDKQMGKAKYDVASGKSDPQTVHSKAVVGSRSENLTNVPSLNFDPQYEVANITLEDSNRSMLTEVKDKNIFAKC